MKPQVYISIGSAATIRQRDAADAIFRTLEAAGLSPRQMERNEWSAEQPLRAIRRVLEKCDGVVVIAFRRYDFPCGTERQKDGSELKLEDTQLTTVWNQIEAAMGYTRGLPLFVIAENGLHAEGLLEGRYDWKVYWTDLNSAEMQSERFIGYLESWKQLVMDHSALVSQSKPDETDLSKISIASLCGRLSVPQLWAAISALIACIGAIACAAFKAGGGRWPW
jgi:hypothetical protein